MPYIYTPINQSSNTKPMVRELDAERCAVRLSAQALANARDNIWLIRRMVTGQCLQFIVLDLAFIVRELQVRIPAHHSSFLPLSHPTPSHSYTYSTPKAKKQGHRTRPTESVRRACLLGHPCSLACNAMQPRSSDRVWEPPAARAPVSAALSRVRPIVVIDVSKKQVAYCSLA